jgi:hypothetical protein
MSEVEILTQLIGKTISKITRLADNKLINDEGRKCDTLEILTAEGKMYKMYHDQDCCESVWLDDIEGNLSDIIGSPLQMAEVVCNHDNNLYGDESHTWTFYKLGTINGYVTLRWYGASNGYYSESVTIKEVAE